MIDTLETAEDFGCTIHGEPVHCAGSPALAAGCARTSFERLFGDWVRLTTAMNADRAAAWASPTPIRSR